MGPHVVFWLILQLSPSQLMHVGNFTSMESCRAAAETAAERALMADFSVAWSVGRTNLICVQANEAGTNPP